MAKKKAAAEKAEATTGDDKDKINPVTKQIELSKKYNGLFAKHAEDPKSLSEMELDLVMSLAVGNHILLYAAELEKKILAYQQVFDGLKNRAVAQEDSGVTVLSFGGADRKPKKGGKK